MKGVMKFPKGTQFLVLKPTKDFPANFHIQNDSAEYVVEVRDDTGHTWAISPLVIEQLINGGKVKVISYPPHPSHNMSYATIGGQGTEFIPGQCSDCMLKQDEDGIQYECCLKNGDLRSVSKSDRRK